MTVFYSKHLENITDSLADWREARRSSGTSTVLEPQADTKPIKTTIPHPVLAHPPVLLTVLADLTVRSPDWLKDSTRDKAMLH